MRARLTNADGRRPAGESKDDWPGRLQPVEDRRLAAGVRAHRLALRGNAHVFWPRTRRPCTSSVVEQPVDRRRDVPPRNTHTSTTCGDSPWRRVAVAERSAV